MRTSRKVLIGLVGLFLIGMGGLGFSLIEKKTKTRKGFAVRIPIQEKIFQQKRAAPPAWMLQTIRRDLEPFTKSGITRKMLDDLFQGERISKHKLIRFSITSGKLSVAVPNDLLDKRYFRHVLAAFEKLLTLAELPDVDFVVSLEDGFYSNVDFPFSPLFVFSKTEGLSPFILIPDFKAMTGYPSLQKEILAGNSQYSWEKKRSLAFWRGTTSGGYLTKDKWRTLSRPKLALFSLTNPQDLDAKITEVSQAEAEVPEQIAAEGLIGKRTTQKNHLKYKYLVDVDGNSCTFERYFWTLLSNSVVLKQTTSNRQWYYSALEPYQHYIPVKEDLSDLLEKIKWAREHDSEAQKIAEKGTDFVKNNLSIEDNFLYLYQLILEYARLQKCTYEPIPVKFFVDFRDYFDRFSALF